MVNHAPSVVRFIVPGKLKIHRDILRRLKCVGMWFSVVCLLWCARMLLGFC